tara:strand:+ start:726 stop:1082 length:357 start_codon:yes stop_codon:yes gene_type:complete
MVLVSVITYLVRDAKVSKVVLFLVLSIIVASFVTSFLFLLFLGYQYIFALNYEYLQLSVSIFLICLTFFAGMLLDKATLKREPFDFTFFFMSLIMSVLAGALFPVVFVMSRFVWSVIF